MEDLTPGFAIGQSLHLLQQPTADPQVKGKSAKAIRESAEEFEALFLAQMLSPMFETLESDGLFGGGHAEQVYRGLLVQEYGKVMARSGGIGIADHVQREIMKMQEVG